MSATTATQMLLRNRLLLVGILSVSVGGLAIVGMLAFVLARAVSEESRLVAEYPIPLYEQPDGTLRTTAHLGGRFHLVDAANGRAVTQASLLGSWHVLYFGYTSCPDVCPTELQHIATALRLMGERGLAITPIFITVDPRRDDAATMAGYVRLFSPRLVGLTGSQDQVDDAIWDYQVSAVIDPDHVGGTDYDVMHSAYMYLVDPGGAVVSIDPPDMSITALARSWTARISGTS